MASYLTVYSDLLAAFLAAMRDATSRGQSQTIFTPLHGPEFYLVGNSSAAASTIDSGVIPLFSIQSHAPSCFRVTIQEEGEEDTEIVGMGECPRCWADLEEEAK